MGKVCLVFVLSLVFVFSASAQQQNPKSVDTSGVVSDVKVSSGTTETKQAVSDATETKKDNANATETKQVTETKVNPDATETQKVNSDATETKNISSGTTETKKISPETTETQKINSETTEVKKAAPDATETKGAVETKTEPVRKPVKKEETDNSKIEKTLPTAKKDSSSTSALRMSENTSLGTFSTGDATIDSYIEAACTRFNIDPLLIFAQMNQESTFNRKATSNKGASGLMQLMPATAMRFGVKNIYNPKQNIEAGVKYMRWLLDKFGGDVRLALAAYNAGEGSVKKYGNQIPPYRETKSYVARISAHYAQITSQILTLAVTTEKEID